MKKHSIQLTVIIWIITISNVIAQTNFPPKPKPARFVNDFANFLTKDEIQRLETKLGSYDKETTTQLVVVTIETLEGLSIEEYANTLARNWGIGQKGKDNGLLILASKQERKLRIEVGYGLEASVTDVQAKQIIDTYLKPNFKNEAFYQGFDTATDAIVKALAGENFMDIDNTKKINYWQYKPGFRLWYYIPLALVIVLMVQSFTIFRGKSLRLRIILFVVLIAWTGFVEGIYFFQFGHKAYIGFVLLSGGVPLFWYFMKRTSKVDILTHRLNMLDKYMQFDTWESLKESYISKEIDSKHEGYLIEYNSSNKNNLTEINKLIKELEKVFKEPHKYFKKREDITLKELIKKTQDKLLTQVVFNESQRRSLDAKMLKFKEKIEHKIYEKFNNKDLQEIRENIAFLQKILDQPSSYFKYDYNYATSQVKQVFKDKFWKKYQITYTESSIKEAKTYFEKKYKAIKNDKKYNDKEKKEKILHLYLEEFVPFLEKPSRKLKKKTSYHHKTSYKGSYKSSYSSGSSYNSSSYSYSDSSSYSSYSDSSFGGGDFGGGGASGDW